MVNNVFFPNLFRLLRPGSPPCPCKSRNSGRCNAAVSIRGIAGIPTCPAVSCAAWPFSVYRAWLVNVYVSDLACLLLRTAGTLGWLRGSMVAGLLFRAPDHSECRCRWFGCTRTGPLVQIFSTRGTEPCTVLLAQRLHRRC